MNTAPSRQPVSLRARASAALPYLAIVIAYVMVENRYPALNNDDTYLLGRMFPAYDGTLWRGGFHEVLFLHGANNEFRTYAFARLAEFVVYEFAGTHIAPYYWVMSGFAVAAVTFASRIVLGVTRSRAATLASMAVLLLGPFSLLQTFHHAAYTVLPFGFACAYGWLATRGAEDRRRRILGPMLCALVVVSGEVVTMILLVALVALIAQAWRAGERLRVRTLLVDLGCTLAVLLVLYLHWRLFLFNPAIEARFKVGGAPDLESVFAAFEGFQSTMLDYLTNARIAEILSYGVTFDPVAACAITVAAIAVIASIASSAESRTLPSKPLAATALVVILYVVSLTSYVFLAAVDHVVSYPARYLHVSGMLALIFLCLACSLAPPTVRKTLLIAAVVVCASNGLVTFAIKVPTMEAAHADLRQRIAEAHGSGVVAFDTPPADGGYLNPYYFAPATTPYTGWWILQNFCPIALRVQCVQGPGRPGDVVIRATRQRPGYPAESSVERKR